ncbi:hypothetical protein Tsubulata_036769 [Turnera subulata]|uniref:Rhodanese domain-containing protein n=1 Tax=Turnera subulata TaxID=218843 RepID=A0A9Q0FNM1_9ROSI|nr:hypothetical protein Tsubulata_036769 [Turnera subulata]
MLPVCSAAPCCSSHSQVPFHGGLRSFSTFSKDFESKHLVEDRSVLGLSNGCHLPRLSFKNQAAKSFYSSVVESNEQSVPITFVDSPSCPTEIDGNCKIYDNWVSSVGTVDELPPIQSAELKYVESDTIISMEDGLADFSNQSTETVGSLTGSLEPETTLPIDVPPENPSSGSDSLNMDTDSLTSASSSLDDFIANTKESFSTSISKGENAVKSSIDSVTASITSITKKASEGVDNALSGVFSTVDQTGELAGRKATSFTDDLREATNKAAATSVDLLRSSVVAAENLIGKGASLVVYSYGSAKELLPIEVRGALNLSEEKATEILRPVSTTFQQVYIAIEGLEKNLGLDPNDPLVPFILLIGSSTTLWVLYRVWVYGGYAGDLSPQLALEFLAGKEQAVLIDVRSEARDYLIAFTARDLRERDGIPDLRRGTRFRYASVTPLEVDNSVRKLLKGGRELDDTLTAAVIRNLKVVQDRYMVIVMDADGTRSKGIARSLRKLGVKRPYLIQGGFKSWMSEGLRIKELKPETTLTILNEEAEAILEDLRPTPVQALGYGVGFVAALYAVLDWEKTLQFIGVIGLGQTIYRRVTSYEGPEDFRQDVRRLLAPVRVGAQTFSWVAGKLETNGIGLPTSPSSSDVQSRVLKAAAKHESQPSDAEGTQNPSLESVAPVTENVDLSEA